MFSLQVRKAGEVAMYAGLAAAAGVGVLALARWLGGSKNENKETQWWTFVLFCFGSGLADHQQSLTGACHNQSQINNTAKLACSYVWFSRKLGSASPLSVLHVAFCFVFLGGGNDVRLASLYFWGCLKFVHTAQVWQFFLRRWNMWFSYQWNDSWGMTIGGYLWLYNIW